MHLEKTQDLFLAFDIIIGYKLLNGNDKNIVTISNKDVVRIIKLFD